jgi:hypothetical protein
MSNEFFQRHECPKCGILWGSVAVRWVETTRIERGEPQHYTPQVLDEKPTVCAHFYTPKPVLRLQEGFDNDPELAAFVLRVKRKANPKFVHDSEESDEPEFLLERTGKPLEKTKHGKKLVESLPDEPRRGSLADSIKRMANGSATTCLPHFVFQEELPIQVQCSCGHTDEIR